MGWALVVSVCLGAPWLTRALLLWEKHVPLRPVDLRGMLADASVALLLMGLTALFVRIGRWWGRALAVAFLVSFVVASFAMYEFIAVFDSLYAFSHVEFLGDATFLGGSARHVRHPVLLASMIAAAIAGGALALAPGARWWRGWGVALGACVLGQVLIPASPAYEGWRQRHAVQAHMSLFFEPVSERPTTISAELRDVFRADLDGRRWVGPLHGRPNVLLIMVEGASGAYLPSVAAAHGVRSSTVMPRLDALAREHVLLTRVVSHQRQTNRGEYGILCGDYPKLLTDQSKMTEQAYGAARRCLPALLRDAGYATAYIQAAPLGFMLKDQFMPKAGFDELIGEPWFDRAYARTDWGIDDKAFFEQALSRVVALHRAEQPFFAAMLTVGTHHPYTIPDAETPGGLAAAHDRAFRWADDALADFVAALRRQGVLRDTVVLITSDESAGLLEAASATQRLLSQSWSFVVAMLPQPRAKRIDTLYGHVDTAISVADLLGMDEGATRFVGRSWFREYDTPRRLFAANTYARSVMMWEPNEAVVVCGEALRQCVRTVAPEGQTFGPKRESQAAAAREQQLLAEVARLTRSSRAALSESDPMMLLTDDEAHLRAGDGKKLLIGGQYLRVPGGTTVRVDLDLEVDGEGAIVGFHHDLLLDGHPKIARENVRVRDGQRWQLRYEIHVPRDAGQLVVQLYAKTVSGESATVRFADARLTMLRAEITSGEPVVIDDSLSPAGPP